MINIIEAIQNSTWQEIVVDLTGFGMFAFCIYNAYILEKHIKRGQW